MKSDGEELDMIAAKVEHLEVINDPNGQRSPQQI